MRFKIQVQSLVGHVLVVITEYDEYGPRRSTTQRLYTFPGKVLEQGGLAELLGQLQRELVETDD